MLITDLLRKKGNEVYWIHPDSSVYEAITEMAEKNIGALVVMDGMEVVGMISERDYAKKVILQGRTSRETKVRDIMSSKVYYITPDKSIEECMALMTNHKFRHCPVIKDKKLLGIISIGDLVKEIISTQQVEIDHLTNYISNKYPA